MKHILAENFVRPDESQKILSRLRKKGNYTVIDMITARLDMKRNQYIASFSNLGITNVFLEDEYPEYGEKHQELMDLILDGDTENKKDLENELVEIWKKLS